MVTKKKSSKPANKKIAPKTAKLKKVADKKIAKKSVPLKTAKLLKTNLKTCCFSTA